MKPGIKTTEFWLTAVTGIVTALIALLVGYGALTGEQGELWTGLVLATAPVAIAIAVASYNNSRARVKAGNGSD